MTWFRRQARLEWIRLEAGESIARAVEAIAKGYQAELKPPEA